jgi:hypothetical protein
MVEKVANINALRKEALVAKGEPALIRTLWLSSLLCKKFVASHHNMQMKIIADTQKIYRLVKDKKL